MNATPTRKLWCIVNGFIKQPFKVQISSDRDIDDLKQKVCKKIEGDVLAKNLAIWKVSSFYTPAKTF
jgi:hypothetical protein